jgi:hypothetical protein
MIAVNDRFSYSAVFPVAEEDLRQYLQDPITALPPTLAALLPPIGIALVPYMERQTPKGSIAVTEEKPTEAKLVLATRVVSEDFATLLFTVKDEQVADYHYFFYDELAALLLSKLPAGAEEAWHRLLREELSAEVHGEVDDRSWHAKQKLLRKPMAGRKDGPPFREYSNDSFRDTLTLYLHGICCDIDVEAGPRQLPSRYLRKRLDALKNLFPPPEGHAVFPEDLPKIDPRTVDLRPLDAVN